MTGNGTLQELQMSRVQKSMMVPDDLYRLIQTIEEKSGATFTRILTAALIAYLFEDMKNAGLHDDLGTTPGPDHVWVRLAVLIERGDLEVADIPIALLDRTSETCEIMSRDEDPNTDRAKLRQKRITSVKGLKRAWKNRIEDDGGKMEALIESIKSRWVS